MMEEGENASWFGWNIVTNVAPGLHREKCEMLTKGDPSVKTDSQVVRGESVARNRVVRVAC